LFFSFSKFSFSLLHLLNSQQLAAQKKQGYILALVV